MLLVHHIYCYLLVQQMNINFWHVSGPPERRVSSYLCRLVDFIRWGQKLNAKSTLSTLILHGNWAVYLHSPAYFCYKATDWSIQVRSYAKYNELFRWTPIDCHYGAVSKAYLVIYSIWHPAEVGHETVKCYVYGINQHYIYLLA